MIPRTPLLQTTVTGELQILAGKTAFPLDQQDPFTPPPSQLPDLLFVLPTIASITPDSLTLSTSISPTTTLSSVSGSDDMASGLKNRYPVQEDTESANEAEGPNFQEMRGAEINAVQSRVIAHPLSFGPTLRISDLYEQVLDLE